MELRRHLQAADLAGTAVDSDDIRLEGAAFERSDGEADDVRILQSGILVLEISDALLWIVHEELVAVFLIPAVQPGADAE